ncbi:PAS domain S-box protein [Nocardioides acrostichi]|uniref:histidine kinase n=1 Tax=Nocardioides acrostichi TaxID=2784339 RepID=A0A930V2D9_9ACTN|nr:PAS domain S-box protein [Nocardioides acrostichi]MBF4163405.1 PAS domain S-box protein [Nocardioides acrostichi]
MTVSGHRFLSLPMTSLLLGVVYLAGTTSVMLRPAGNPVAVWWPAAGVAVALVVYTRPGRAPLALAFVSVLVVTALANMTAGRDAASAFGFGLGNAGEAVVAGLIIRAGSPGRPPRMRTLADFLRLLVAAVAGGLVISAIVGLVVAMSGMGGGWEAARDVLPSHAAAVVVIVALTMSRSGNRWLGSSLELGVQGTLGAVITLLVFGPDQELSLTFVPLLFLAWAGVRFDVRVTAVEMFGLAVVSTTLTRLGWGPFNGVAQGQPISASTAATLNQAYLVGAALLGLSLALIWASHGRLLDRVAAAEVLFRRSFTDSLLGQLLLRRDGEELVVAEFNARAAVLLGRDHDSLLGASLRSLVEVGGHTLPEETSSAHDQTWRAQVEVSARVDSRVEMALSRLQDDAGEGPMWSAQLLDVSAEHHALQQLRTAQDLTAATLDTTAAIILLADLDGRIVRVNAATTQTTGFSAQDLVGRLVWETTLSPGDAEEIEAMMLWPNRSGTPLARERDAITKDGKRRRVSWSNNMVRDELGHPTYMVITGIDVTTERASAGLVSHLMQAAITTAIVGADENGRITVANHGAARMLGCDRADLVGARFVDQLDREQLIERLGTADPATAFSAIVERARVNEAAVHDWRWVSSSGTSRIVSMTVSALEGATSHVGILIVARDVTEQRRGQEMLMAALEKERTAVERLKALDQAKNEFVSTVSHELRTPVTSIVGYTEMLSDGSIVDPLPEQQVMFDTIARNGQRLITLCNDLLMLAGLDSGSVTWKAEDVDLGDVLKLVEEWATPLVAGRSLDVRFEHPTRPLVVVGDGAQIERVLSNLVANAVKCTEHGYVRVDTTVDDDHAVIRVSDSGMGIPLDEQDHVFQRFFRTSNAEKKAVQGTGLGLAIVASIVEAHGGTVALQSEVDHGATFTVSLPLKR